MTLGIYLFAAAFPPNLNSRRKTHRGRAAFSLLILALFAAVSFIGCALTGAESNNTPQQMAVTPSAASFGSVRIGHSGWKTVTVTNQGTTALTISHAAITGSSFGLSGLSIPLNLAAGKSAVFGVKFTPHSVQPVTGSLTISSTSGSPMTIPLSGWGGQSQMSLSPSKLNFGSVSVGASSTQTITITDPGNAALNVTSAMVSGAGFSLLGGFQTMTIADNQSATLTLQFAPQTGGHSTGSLTLVSDAPTSPVTVSLSGTGVSSASPQLSINPTNINFGNVNVGSSSQRTVTLSNTGNVNVTITQAAPSGAGFSISGISTPLTLSPGQNSSFSLQFAPQAPGNVTGGVTIASNANGSPATILLSGAGISASNPQLGVNPTSINFNSVTVGSSSLQPVNLTNTGNVSVTVSQAVASGAGFSISGISTPLTLAPGQNSSFSVKFAPSSTGIVTGSVTITSNASGSPATILLSGAGVSASNPQLGINPTSINFNSVTVGSSSQQPVNLSNTGTVSVTVSQAVASGAGFSISSISTPLTLAPGQNSSFSVKFAPSGTGNATGSVTITSNASGSPATISLSGAGVAAPTPQLTVTPNLVTFNSVVTGTTSSQTVKLSNSGNANLTINTANVSGAGFSMSGLTTPLTLSTNQSTTFTAQFAPQSTGGASGSVVFNSNDPKSPTTVQLSGTGVAATLSLTPNPGSVNFGNVNLGSSSSQNVTLTNSGNSNINISQVTVTGAGFSAGGVTPPMTLTPGQMATLSVTFSPSGTGNATGNIQVVSNASSPTNISLSGSGVQAVSHSATLTWTASTSVVVGYNIYRGGQSGGPYTKLNSSPVAATTYVDATVQAGQTYFWVVTAVDSSGTESVFSNEVTATIPTP